MIETLLSKIGAVLIGVAVFLTGVFAPVSEPVGVDLPSGTAVFETSLAAPISSSATTMTLTANSVRGGGSLSGYQCFTIDEGSAQAEYVCGTVSATTVSSLERGISPADGVTEDADLQFSHRRGASVKITDFPLIQRIASQNSGSGTYEAPLSYADGVTPTGASELADVEYVLSAITGTSTLAFNRIIVSGTAGETIASGNVVYLKPADQRWYKLDTDDTSTFVDREIGIAQGAGTSGTSIAGGILTYGIDGTQKGMTPGAYIFGSGTAGATSTATTSQVIGKAISATTLFVDQNLIDSSVYIPTTFTATTTFTAPVIGIGSTTIRATTTSGVYTKPTSPTFKYAVVEVQGAGGNGFADGGGGGGGAYVKKIFSASDLTATTSVVVGTAGIGSGSTSFGTLSAPNGLVGADSAGGAGGTATSGVININGQDGEAGAGCQSGGGGGSSWFGFGAIQVDSPSGTAARNGLNGSGFGAGGGGGVEANDCSPGGGGGGSGTGGIVIITEYF